MRNRNQHRPFILQLREQHFAEVRSLLSSLMEILSVELALPDAMTNRLQQSLVNGSGCLEWSDVSAYDRSVERATRW
jgi:hypothetical protein